MSSRDNGLTAGTYVFLAEVAPPVTDEVLAELREEGIAAYAVPVDPPINWITRSMSRIDLPSERVYVDRASAAYAQVLARRQIAEYDTGAAGEPQPAEGARPDDEDAAWNRIIADYDRTVTGTERTWPAAEDIETETEDRASSSTAPQTPTAPVVGTDTEAATDVHERDADDEHYVPPPPPPLPKEDMPTKAAFGALALGLVAVCLMVAFDWARQWWVALLALALLVAAVVTHVIRIRDPRNPGSGDGAEV